MLDHNKYMHRCLELARNGLGNAAPNPMVGSVIVYNHKIIGEGYHIRCGQAHAEVNAVRSVKGAGLLQESTIYVNLEPCAHFGKTPPCADLIIEKKIPRVVIACVDTFSKVAGQGIERLRNAGCEVIVGILEKEARELNRRFFTFHEKKRPYIILKWAQTADGFMDIVRTPNTPVQPNWITDETSRMLVHKWRTEEQGIAIGRNTAIKDNPRLNARDWPGHSPVRILFDTALRAPKSLAIYDGAVPTLVVNSLKGEISPEAEYILVDKGKGMPDIHHLLTALHGRDIQSVIVEGGPKILASFIHQNLWDEARIFTGNIWFRQGIKAPVFPFEPDAIEPVSSGALSFYRNTESAT
jgi:diaminohydroxyphosphoribosylaminopyrimidine deaminase / 5-amino-6-(5-phosphoribosylamino)uracil reductase